MTTYLHYIYTFSHEAYIHINLFILYLQNCYIGSLPEIPLSCLRKMCIWLYRSFEQKNSNYMTLDGIKQWNYAIILIPWWNKDAQYEFR